MEVECTWFAIGDRSTCVLFNTHIPGGGGGSPASSLPEWSELDVPAACWEHFWRADLLERWSLACWQPSVSKWCAIFHVSWWDIMPVTQEVWRQWPRWNTNYCKFGTCEQWCPCCFWPGISYIKLTITIHRWSKQLSLFYRFFGVVPKYRFK